MRMESKDDNSGRSSQSLSYVIVRNIPKNYHSHDLRRFFTTFTETSKFECFHYRHRPEVKLLQQPDGEEKELSKEEPDTEVSRCCIIKLKSEYVADFLSSYNEKHWTNDQSEEMPTKCFLMKVKVISDEEGKDRVFKKNVVSESDLTKMPELRPPGIMPQGNVGTPTEFFFKAIKECRLPPNIITKLRLEFPYKRRNRKYGSVPFDYGDSKAQRSTRSFEQLHHLNKSGPRLTLGKTEDNEDDDDDTCEEWERHEAFHNDVAARRVNPTDISQQPGTKERLFEEEMEVVWEKGGSGLVFYTDAQYWKEKEGDFDEQTTDDWDVDMSVYYEDGAGDKDARDSVEMRSSTFREKGQLVESAFRKRKQPNDAERTKRRPKAFQVPEGQIGQFERHTRGFGRRILERQGWKEGEGLGKTFRGMSDALENEGQTSKAGLGYYGEVVPRFTAVSTGSRKVVGSRKRTSIRDVIISTAFDKPEDLDPSESVMRTNPETYLAHRKQRVVTSDLPDNKNK